MSRKNKYIPHLAEFFFEPEFNWSLETAKEMYEKNEDQSKNRIEFKDSIKFMKKMNEESVDLIIADPPFGIDFTGKEAIYNRKKENVVKNYHEVNENYQKFSFDWISELSRIMKKSASAYIVSGYTNLRYVLEAIDNSNLILKNHIIWNYNFGVFTKRKFVTSHYHILFVVKNDRKYFFHRIEHYPQDVWVIPRTYKANQRKNGTKLPEALVQKMIDFSSKPGDLVFDPFMGNGTTAVVAKANFRHYKGFEINKQMKPIISENLKKIEVGQDYSPYLERIPTPEELSKNHCDNRDYQRAYEIYLTQQDKMTI